MGVEMQFEPLAASFGTANDRWSPRDHLGILGQPLQQRDQSFEVSAGG